MDLIGERLTLRFVRVLNPAGIPPPQRVGDRIYLPLMLPMTRCRNRDSGSGLISHKFGGLLRGALNNLVVTLR